MWIIHNKLWLAFQDNQNFCITFHNGSLYALFARGSKKPKCPWRCIASITPHAERVNGTDSVVRLAFILIRASGAWKISYSCLTRKVDKHLPPMFGPAHEFGTYISAIIVKPHTTHKFSLISWVSMHKTMEQPIGN